MDKECMLTTFDNPFNPFEDIMAWRLFDMEKGYYSSERLAKIAQPLLKEDMTQKEENEAIEHAIDTIIKNDILNVYKKVTRPA